MFNPGIGMNNIFIGTSGYYYPDWRSSFYPGNLKGPEFLNFYSKNFNFVEINSTYYRPVSRKQLEKMIDQVPDSFLFTLKAHGSITHERSGDPSEKCREFIENTSILRDTGHLGGYLLQFPYSFHRTAENRKYLDRICGMFRGLPVFIEFRHREWIDRKVIEDIKSRGMTLVTTDLPEVRNLPENKSVIDGKDSIYLRFHGRNRDLWWTGDSTSRYDYTYSTDELKDRAKEIIPMNKGKKLIFIAFNNHYKGQAVKNAFEMKKIFKDLR